MDAINYVKSLSFFFFIKELAAKKICVNINFSIRARARGIIGAEQALFKYIIFRAHSTER